jgi:hypothetical protein
MRMTWIIAALARSGAAAESLPARVAGEEAALFWTAVAERSGDTALASG